MTWSMNVLAPNNLVDFHHTPILEHLQLSLQQETVRQSDALKVDVLVLGSLLRYPIWHSKTHTAAQKQDVKYQWKRYMSDMEFH